MRNYKIPEVKESSEQMKAWKAELAEQRRKADYEKFLREQMAFEESRQLREKHGI